MSLTDSGPQRAVGAEEKVIVVHCDFTEVAIALRVSTDSLHGLISIQNREQWSIG
jgi:hypothetical protein